MKPSLGEITRKYKYSNKRLYSIYKAMIGRCTDPNEKRYKNYGGRGVKVCDEWLNGYDNFAEWAYSSGYDDSAKHGACTLDRIDTNGDYCPSNCRWVSNLRQQNNRTTNRLVEYDGKVQSIADWARELNLPYSKVYVGITRKGMSVGDFKK